MLFNKAQKIVMVFLITAILTMGVSCDKKETKTDSTSQNTQSEATNQSSDTESDSKYIASDREDKFDFTGLASQKYADVFAQKDKSVSYALKWSYGEGYEDKGINYIYCDPEKSYYSINMTQPLFNNSKFILKDHVIYDIYDDSKVYAETDMYKAAMENGYLTISEFESFAADIFAGLYYLGSGTKTIDGKEYDFDAYFTTKQVELWFILDENGELYAIEPIFDYHKDEYMYIEDFSTEYDENVYEIPEGYEKFVE